MTFKPAVWYPIALVLTAINLAGAGFAAGTTEPWHATIHAVLALGFGLWAQRLRRAPRGGGVEAPAAGRRSGGGRDGGERGARQEEPPRLPRRPPAAAGA